MRYQWVNTVARTHTQSFHWCHYPGWTSALDRWWHPSDGCSQWSGPVPGLIHFEHTSPLADVAVGFPWNSWTSGAMLCICPEKKVGLLPVLGNVAIQKSWYSQSGRWTSTILAAVRETHGIWGKRFYFTIGWSSNIIQHQPAKIGNTSDPFSFLHHDDSHSCWAVANNAMAKPPAVGSFHLQPTLRIDNIGSLAKPFLD